MGGEAFGGSVLGDTDYLSILTPETGTYERVNCTRYTWYRREGEGRGKGGGSAPPLPSPSIRPCKIGLRNGKAVKSNNYPYDVLIC